jgi:acyl transferase domain-containing protein
VIKRLCDAIRDGDMVRAVIRNSLSNQDGHTPGIHQPSQAAQEALIRDVYKGCDLDLRATRFVEAHGTGTKLGDATEAKSIGRVFRSSRSPKEPLYVGSVKSNFGHLEGASALAGIFKAIIMLEKGVIPPNALFEALNPKVNAKLNNLQIPTSCLPWPCAGLRRISLSSFGFGGTNGHIILDDALHTMERLGVKALINTARSMLVHHGLQNGAVDGPLEQNAHKTNGSNGHTTLMPSTRLQNGVESVDFSTKFRLLVWSARDEAALKRMLESYVKYSEQNTSRPKSHIDTLAYTLAARKSLMSWRSFAVAGGQESSNVIRFDICVM